MATHSSILAYIYIQARCLVAQQCLTPCDPMDYSPHVSSVHGISQARILEWGALLSSRGSSQPRDRTHTSPASVDGMFTTEPPEKPMCVYISVYIYTHTHTHVHACKYMLYVPIYIQDFPGVSGVKNLPAVPKILVRLLGQEDPLEKEKTTDSSILDWKSNRERRLVGYSPQDLRSWSRLRN